MKIKELGLITKQEVLDQLKRYGIKIKSRTLAYYIAEKLIEPPIRKGMPGITGSVSFFREQTPLKITNIKSLIEKFELTLKEISKYKDLGFNFDELKINKLNKIEYAKFETVMTAYACAEVGYDNWFKIKSREGKVCMPQMYVKKEKNRIIEVHIKIIEINVLGRSTVTGESIKDLEAFKEIIFSKEGMKIIG